MWRRAFGGLCVLLYTAAAHALVALHTFPRDPAVSGVVVDTRPQADCVHSSLQGAICLAPQEFLGPHGRLASWRNIRWLLGASGLSGSETVVVAGDNIDREDFVAGVLYLAGQRHVEIVYRRLSRWLISHPHRAAAGLSHGVFRQAIYTAWPRTRLIILRQELGRLIRKGGSFDLMDGRPADQYAGLRILAARGGHIPGAQPFTMSQALRTSMVGVPPSTRRVIAYDEDPYRSIAYFAQLRTLHMPAHVFVGGWQDWAAHTSFPVDDATYPVRVGAPLEVARTAVGGFMAGDGRTVVAAALAALVAGFVTIRFTRRS